MTDYLEFERLCHDLMRRYYKEYIPIGGTGDLGRDGLIVIEEERLFHVEVTRARTKRIFQYSVRKDSLTKIKQTGKRLAEANIEYDSMIFVTPRPISTDEDQKAKKAFLDETGKELLNLSQEFLRTHLQANENRDLTELYFAQFLAQLRSFGIEPGILQTTSQTDYRKKRAQVILNCCIRSDVSTGVRKSALMDLIKGALFTRNSDHIKEVDLGKEIRFQFGSDIQFSPKILSEAIDSLLKKGEIERKEEFLLVAPHELVKIEAKVDQALEQRDCFRNGIEMEIRARSKGSEEEIHIAANKVIEGVYKVLDLRAFEISKLLLTKNEKQYEAVPEVSLIASKIESETPKEIARAASETFLRLFSDPTSDESKHLYFIAEAFFIYACFHLDSDARTLDLEDLKSNQIFIDTDVIFQLFVGCSHQKRFLSDLIKGTHRLGVKMLVVMSSITEFVRRVTKANRDFVEMNFPTSLPEIALDSLGDVIKNFIQNHVSSELNWSEYIRSLIGHQHEETLRCQFVLQKLEELYNIELAAFPTSKVTSIDINMLSVEIAEERASRGSYKHLDLYDADSELILKIEEKVLSGKNERCWVLSSDRVISRIWAKRNPTIRPRIFFPESWFQYISTHPGSIQNPTSFSSVLKSLTTSPLRPTLPKSFVITLVQLGVDMHKYTEQALQELSENLYKQKLWKDALCKKDFDYDEENTNGLALELESVLSILEKGSPEAYKVELDMAKQQLQKIKAEKEETERKLKIEEKKNRGRARHLKRNRKKE